MRDSIWHLKTNYNHMKILMFGWEFPPYISGGLGTACEGIVAGLVKNKVAVTMVLPKASLRNPNANYQLLDAGSIGVPASRVALIGKQLQERAIFIGIKSPIKPYESPTEFRKTKADRTNNNPDETNKLSE